MKINLPKKIISDTTLKINSAINAERIRSEIGFTDYRVIQHDLELFTYLTKALEAGVLAIDTETTGVFNCRDKVVGVGLCYSEDSAVYIPYLHKRTKNNLSLEAFKKFFEALKNSDCKLIFHNAIFDLTMIDFTYGVRLKSYFDTEIASQLYDNEESHTLKYQYSKFAGTKKTASFKELFAPGTFGEHTPEEVAPYAAFDPYMTLIIFKNLVKYFIPDTPEFNETQKDIPHWKYAVNAFWTVEMPLVDVVVSMQMNGMAIDKEALYRLQVKYEQKKIEADKLVQEEYKKLLPQIEEYRLSNPKCPLRNEGINVSSSPEMFCLLYDVLKLKPPKGKRTANKDTLVGFADKISFSKAIVESRHMENLLSTFVYTLRDNWVNSGDGAVHGSYQTCATDTYRLSSKNPNMQNIPAEGFRHVYIARPGHLLLGADFKSQEPRLAADWSKDENLIKAFLDDLDVYLTVVERIYGIPYEESLAEYEKNDKWKPRKKAKVVFLALLYGKGERTLAEDLGVHVEEAKDIIASVKMAYPKLDQFVNSCVEYAKKWGYTYTKLGHVRRLRDIQLPEIEVKYSDGTVVSPSKVAELSKDICSPYRKDAYDRYAEAGFQLYKNSKRISSAMRQAINTRIQGSAADQSKLAMLKIHYNPEFQDIGGKILAAIHDEVLVEVPVEHLDTAKRILDDAMSNSLKLLVPSGCDFYEGISWGEES